MSEQVRLWEIGAEDRLTEIIPSKLDFEARLENWLEQDISILSNNLIVIGRQVSTAYGGVIDLLCLDSQGDIVIVELKRDKTSREVTAQALDYASWIQGLTNDEITGILNRYLGAEANLEQLFTSQFGTELPETLNNQHKIIIVASEIDSSTERIIQYLSGTYGVSINAATFSYFRDASNREILARVFLIEPEQVEQRAAVNSKRQPNRTYQELEETAVSNGVGELFTALSAGLAPAYFWWSTNRSALVFSSKGKSRKVLLSLNPIESSPEGLKFQIYSDRLAKQLGIEVERLSTLLPPYQVAWQAEWAGTVCQGLFKTQEEVNLFLSNLQELSHKSSENTV